MNDKTKAPVTIARLFVFFNAKSTSTMMISEILVYMSPEN